MTLHGVVKNGALVFDEPLDIPDGTRLRIDFTGETVSETGETILTGVLYILGASNDSAP